VTDIVGIINLRLGGPTTAVYQSSSFATRPLLGYIQPVELAWTQLLVLAALPAIHPLQLREA